jgi:hypothetical protein
MLFSAAAISRPLLPYCFPTTSQFDGAVRKRLILLVGGTGIEPVTPPV